MALAEGGTEAEGGFGEWNIIGASFHADSTEARRPHLAAVWMALAPAMPPIEPLRGSGCRLYMYVWVLTFHDLSRSFQLRTQSSLKARRLIKEIIEDAK